MYPDLGYIRATGRINCKGNVDALAKWPERRQAVIPVEAGIQSFKLDTNLLDTGFRRGDVFLRMHQHSQIIKRYAYKETMMKVNLDMTRSRFVALSATIILLLTLIYVGWSELVQCSKLALIIAIMIACAGIIPFFLGVAVQAIFRKKTIPSYAAWVFAFILATAQWRFTSKMSIMLFAQEIMSLVLSFFIIGVFASAGVKSCRAFMEGRKERLQNMNNSLNDENLQN